MLNLHSSKLDFQILTLRILVDVKSLNRFFRG